jgi:hypothetical protein
MRLSITVLALAASVAGPAFANECPALKAQIDAALGTRYDAAAGNAKALAAQAMALHQEGKHTESVKAFDVVVGEVPS